MQILEMFKSKWCWLSTALAFLLSLYIIKSSFQFATYSLLIWIDVALFTLLFSLSFSCTVRTIKLKLKEKKFDKKEGIRGMVNLLLYIIGITTLQTCAFSGVCGVNLTLSFLSIFLPFWASQLLIEYSIYILFGINILLFISLLTMKCFVSYKETPKVAVKLK